MADIYFSEDGDIKVSVNGDLAVTQTAARDIAQQIYIRVMTELGDFVIYPNLGAQLDQLIGMSQTSDTGIFGEQIILEALRRDGRLQGRPLSVKAVPVGPQTVRFDIYTLIENRNSLILSVEQDLGVI
jgi:hypothetical protein